MNVLSLAARNLLRNRRRSSMTLLAMMIGLVAVLLFGGYIRDINYALQSDYVRLTGHLQVQRKNYFRYGSGNPAAYGIRNYDDILLMLKTDAVLAPMLAVATPTLQFGAIAGNFDAGVSRTVYVNGSVVEDQSRMHAWNDYGIRMLSQHPSLSGTSPDTAVIGTGVARVLQLCAELAVPDCEATVATPGPPGAGLPDDVAALVVAQGPSRLASGPARRRIEILATNAHGAPNVAAVNVARAEFQGIKELDDVHVALHLSQAQRLIFGAERPQVTAIALQLQHTAQLPLARARLAELLSGRSTEPLEVIDYETLNPYYGQTMAMFDTMFGFIAILIGGIVLFTVGNTMSMTVVERTSEIGTLRAIGLRRGGIRALFLTEGLLLGALGALLGTIAAIAAAWGVNGLGLTWIPPGRIEPVALAVRVASEHRMMAAGAAGLVVVAVLSAIMPATRAARMNIVDALRHV